LALTDPLTDALAAREGGGAPQTAEVVLLLDNREIFGQGGARALYVKEMEHAMVHAGLPIQERVLPVGDAMFIARLPDGMEIVLDWIVERKTVSDFVASAADGRVKHQTFAMNACGLSNKMLVLEGRSSDLAALAEEGGRTGAELETMLSDLHVCDGFFVHRTKNMRETVDTFVSMRRRLAKRFAWMERGSLVNGRLQYAAWKDRAAANSKRMTLKQLFMLQLCGVAGIGPTGAGRVVARGLDTPAKLNAAYRTCCDGAPRAMEDLLRGRAGDGGRGLSAAASSAICKVFTLGRYDTDLVE
jgi:ERCC4-type nuclease